MLFRPHAPESAPRQKAQNSPEDGWRLSRQEIEERTLRHLATHGDLEKAVAESARPGAGVDEMRHLQERIRTLAQGTGPEVARLLAINGVTDVLINSTHAWIDRGFGLEEHEFSHSTDTQTRALAVHMAAACGKRLDDASPIVDGTLEGGIRLHAVLPAPSASGTLISLRTPRARGMGLSEMEECGSVAPVVAQVLRALCARRANVLISGATGSGKTTLLSALLSLVPGDERIVCIEEIPELHPDHAHAVSLVERHPNVQGKGGISLSELVRAAMRMRPDRLILGECRGPEVRDVMLAFNTGHDGGWATLHANSAEDVPARLHALGGLAGLSDSAVINQSVAAFDAVIHMRRSAIKPQVSQPSDEAGPHTDASGVEQAQLPGRWVGQIGILKRQGGELVCELALEVSQDGTAHFGSAWPDIQRLCGLDGGTP